MCQFFTFYRPFNSKYDATGDRNVAHTKASRSVPKRTSTDSDYFRDHDHIGKIEVYLRAPAFSSSNPWAKFSPLNQIIIF
jgi:hypothetical protein